MPAFKDTNHDKTVTAAQLRRLGFYVRENIPDTSFVNRNAVTLDPDEQFDDGSATLGLIVTETFRPGPPL